MADVLYHARHVIEERPHDYLYDSAYIVSGARDYTRRAFQAAMQSAQVTVQPLFDTMFTDNKNRQRNRMVFHPNCRLPNHMDLSYRAYLDKRRMIYSALTPDLMGKSRYQFNAMPREVLPVNTVEPDFNPQRGSPRSYTAPGVPVHRGTQSIFRESSAQTRPWQPDAKAAPDCVKKPEVLYLDNLHWGPGEPYRTADLPADFHTTEIINKMRHARVWMDLIDSGKIPSRLKDRSAIIREVEMNDWIFREAEIDELQGIRLNLLHKMTEEERQTKASRNTRKLAELWHTKKKEMQHKIEIIKRARDRGLRKLSTIHNSGGSVGLVNRLRASRAGGPVTYAAFDPTSDFHAPLARHGYQARGRHAVIYYDPELITYEDHQAIGEPPPWLEKFGMDLKQQQKKKKSTRPKGRAPELCERESKWSETFLENLHNELKKARLGAAMSVAGPLHVLRPRRLHATPRPATPTVDAVTDSDETTHQAALVLQRLVRGRAVQTLMYEGRTRAAELTAELKSTHGLQKEDKIKIDSDEARARDYNAKQSEAEQKEDAIAALVDELCGGAVSAALDFLEKELRRLKYERRQHAFILIALREKTMREAAEAGRRQKEIHRRREHDEIFKQVLGLTQETVDVYLREIIEEGVALAAEDDAVKRATQEADRVDYEVKKQASVSSAEQNELVAELVQQFLLPEAHKSAARHRIAQLQKTRVETARKAIFGLLSDAQDTIPRCTICDSLLDDKCRCRKCPVTQEPVATSSRLDPRWKATRRREKPPPKSWEERFPMDHDMRCMINSLIDDVALVCNERREAKIAIYHDMASQLRSRTEATIDAHGVVDKMFRDATGIETEPPVERPEYKYLMRRSIGDALARTAVPRPKRLCPEELPTARRVREAEAIDLIDPTCRCIEPRPNTPLDIMKPERIARLLPADLRILEEMRRCKCDVTPHSSPRSEHARSAAPLSMHSVHMAIDPVVDIIDDEPDEDEVEVDGQQQEDEYQLDEEGEQPGESDFDDDHP